MREGAVYVLGIKLDTLALQYVEHQVVRWPEIRLRIGIRTETILVAYKDKPVVGMTDKKRQSPYCSGHELELGIGVYLLILWLSQDSSVAIYE